jgi:hypothetical protein
LYTYYIYVYIFFSVTSLSFSKSGHFLWGGFSDGSFILLERQDLVLLWEQHSGKIQNLPSVVTVQAHSEIPVCTKLLVEPVSVEDWELLEVHSQELELGGLLQQVSVVFANQRLSLQLERDSVEVVVKETFTMEESSIWPTTRECEAPPCVLLVQDTEVIVEPKPRPPSERWSTPPLRWGFGTLTPERVRLVTGDTQIGRWDAEFLANPNQLITECGVLILSPTLQAGHSIDVSTVW